MVAIILRSCLENQKSTRTGEEFERGFSGLGGLARIMNIKISFNPPHPPNPRSKNNAFY